VGLKYNGLHQPQGYADDVYLLGDNIETIKKNTETLNCASKEIHRSKRGHQNAHRNRK
jgi:hypothetical protein